MNIDELAKAVHEARLARGWSVEEAARRAGINRVTYKRIEDALPVQDVKRRTVETLFGIGEVRATIGAELGASAAAIAAADLNPDLAEFNDQELLDEVAGRMRLAASRLQAESGAELLIVTVDQDGQRSVVSNIAKGV